MSSARKIVVSTLAVALFATLLIASAFKIVDYVIRRSYEYSPADQNPRDRALISAVEKGDTRKVEDLLNGGANPNTYTHIPPMESVLQRAKKLKEDKIVDILIKRGATP